MKRLASAFPSDWRRVTVHTANAAGKATCGARGQFADAEAPIMLENFAEAYVPCRSCNGTRKKPDANAGFGPLTRAIRKRLHRVPALKGLRVFGSRGTGAGWVHVNGTGESRYFTDAEEGALREHFGIQYPNSFRIFGPDSHDFWLGKLGIPNAEAMPWLHREGPH